MKRSWIPALVFTSVGVVCIVGLAAVSIANKVDYEVLSYQVQYLDKEGVTFRLMFGVWNPTRFNLDVWQQQYDVYVAGYKVSQITATGNYKLLAGNMSIIPLDIRLLWADVEQKIAPLLNQYDAAALGDLPVLIRGHLAAKMGYIQFTRIPFRMTLPLSDFLP